LIAALTLREQDTIHLAELHPQEIQYLRAALVPWDAHIYPKDGFELALALTPPTPRRGMMLIDPSYEVKADYDAIPHHIANIARKWNVGVIALWYPLLVGGPHGPMLQALEEKFPQALRSEVRFAPAREGHKMEGSGMFVINAPYGLDQEASQIADLFKAMKNA
jgi:23S rRNA (adenine2030-N6)-methyltransferase